MQTRRIHEVLNQDALPSSLLGPRWYAVQCLSHREAGARAHLNNQDFEIFLPRRRKRRRHAGKTDIVLSPLFPGYLFVRLNLARDRWRSINGTVGVASLVMQGGYPAPVPDGVFAALRQSCDDDGVIALEQKFTVGQSVRLLDGPFADFVGELERVDGTERVRILLELLGRRISVGVQRDNVIHANSCF